MQNINNLIIHKLYIFFIMKENYKKQSSYDSHIIKMVNNIYLIFNM